MRDHPAWTGACLLIFLAVIHGALHAQMHMGGDRMHPDSTFARALIDSALAYGEAYSMLAELTGSIGGRVSGSAESLRAVDWGKQAMMKRGLDNVRLQHVLVPHWVRGATERASIVNGPKGQPVPLHICALGGSVSTPGQGISAGIIEVKSLAEAEKLGEKARGKIIFFNRPMNRTFTSTFDAYGDAVDQRVMGAVSGAKVGAVAVLVRSMTTVIDSVPHTGMLLYADGIPQIPAAAVSTADAEMLSALLRKQSNVQVALRLNCRTLPDVLSANVIGEIRGYERPDEVIVIGGHLDSWDLGQGAHDDGAGCVQTIEALRLLKSMGIRPRRTIRAVLFMNEENGLRGASAYADSLPPGERHIAAIESDRGGFAPRGFNIDGTDQQLHAIAAWAPLFDDMGATWFRTGEAGADVGPLKGHGALPIGLLVESHRYFDYHHSAKDTFDKVNERELELGAASMALLAYLLSEHDL